MSSQAMTWAWRQTIPQLPALDPTPDGNPRARVNPATAKNVLLALAEHANPDGKCWPSWKRVAAMVGCSRATVARAIRDLEEAGLIRRVAQYHDRGGQTSSVYTLMMGEGLPRLAMTAKAVHPPSQHDTETPRLTKRPPPQSQPEMDPVASEDPAPSLGDTPRTSQREPKNTNIKGGRGVIDVDSIRVELASRGYDEKLIDYVLGELSLTGGENVKYPLRYCIAAAERRREEIEKASARAMIPEWKQPAPVDQHEMDARIEALPEDQLLRLREEAEMSLSPIARRLEPAIKAAMREAFRKREEVGA